MSREKKSLVKKKSPEDHLRKDSSKRKIKIAWDQKISNKHIGVVGTNSEGWIKLKLEVKQIVGSEKLSAAAAAVVR